MFKRIFLFLLTNIAVLAVITIVIAILENVFGIQISGYSTSYVSILIYAAIVGFTGSFISLLISKWVAKRAYNVVLITSENLNKLDEKERHVYDIVQRIADNNHIKIPEVGIYEDRDPNAFATGATKNSSLVAVSTGLLELMNKDEIEGVIAHEMAHILNGDMVTMTLLQGVVNTFVVFLSRILANIFDNVTDGKFGALGYFLVNLILQILLGILASLITMAFSRYREYRADEGSATFVGKEKMIAGLRALQKMQNLASSDSSELATMKISTKSKGGFLQYFSSHPDLEDRIKNLESKSF
ncbi:MAG: protease HtpX [Candidatus Altimarinota bacterium]